MPRSMWGNKASRFERFFGRLQNRAATAAAEEYRPHFYQRLSSMPDTAADSGAYRRSGPPEKMGRSMSPPWLSRKLRDSQFNVVMTKNRRCFHSTRHAR